MPSTPRYMQDDIDSQTVRLTGRPGAARQYSIKPIIVPQTTADWSSPFVRGYAEVLARQYNISPARWLAFVDGLNEVLVQNAPLAIAKTVSGLASWAPSLIVSSVATGVQIGAGVGDRVRSKKLSSAYLKTANEQLFRPRGLICEIHDTNATLALLGLPPSAGSTMDEMVDQARMRAAGQAGQSNTVETSFRPFGDRVQPLILVEQSVASASNASMMQKMNSMSVGMEKWRDNRKQQKAADKLMEAQQKGRQRDINKAMSKYASTTGQTVQGVSQRQGLIGSLKSKLGGGSTLWLVVVPLEDDVTEEVQFEQLSIDEQPRRAVPPPPMRASPPAYHDDYPSQQQYVREKQYY